MRKSSFSSFGDQLNAVTEAQRAKNCEEVVFARLEEHWQEVDQLLRQVEICANKSQKYATSWMAYYSKVYREVLLAGREDEHWAGGRQLRPPEWRREEAAPTISKILQILPGCEQKSSWFTFLIQAASLLASVRSSGSRVAVSLFKFSVFPAPVSFHSPWITTTVSMHLGTRK